jgi:hypothetical protein
MRHAARPPTSPDHTPRRAAADLIGSRAVPPDRPAHRHARHAALAARPPTCPRRPAARPPSRSATGPRRLALVTPTPDLADHHRLRARASTEKARSGRG